MVVAADMCHKPQQQHAISACMAIAELKCCQLVLKRVQAAGASGYCHVYHEALASFSYQQDAATHCSDQESLCWSCMDQLCNEQDLSLACNIFYKLRRQALTDNMFSDCLLSGYRLQTRLDGK